MFTISCSTCEANLVVKDEALSGKILACPNCGGMVLVQPIDNTSKPLPRMKSTVHKRFPDVLSRETASGIIGPLPETNRLSDILLDAEPSSNLHGTEIKARKLLVGILLGLLVFLLVALGFLMMPRKQEPPQPPVQEPIPHVPEKLPPAAEAEPVAAEEIVAAPPLDVPPSEEEMPIEPVPIEDEPTPVPNANDTLTVFEQRMPGFVDMTLPNIDMDAKLALPILELNLDQQSLIGFNRAMMQLTEIPMTLDIDEMKSRSLSAQTPVKGQFGETTVKAILTETLATLGLQWAVTDRQILILPKETNEPVDLTFDISDFAEEPEVLAEMVRKLLCPGSNISVSNDQLMIEQDGSSKKSQQRQRNDVLRFLEQLRIVRQLTRKTELTGETLAPEAFGWDRVIEPMTLNYYQTVPLARAVEQLESLTKLTILVDHQSLHRSLCSYASLRAIVQCDQGTVNDAMELLLASVDSVALAYRIIDHQTLEITTAESVRQPEKMVVEIHPYQLQEDETPENIVRLLRTAVAPESWATESPETKYGGNIVIDERSNCLLIRQSQPMQRQIRLCLSDAVLREP